MGSIPEVEKSIEGLHLELRNVVGSLETSIHKSNESLLAAEAETDSHISRFMQNAAQVCKSLEELNIIDRTDQTSAVDFRLLKSDNERLSYKVQHLEIAVARLKVTVSGLRDECNRYKRKTRELQTRMSANVKLESTENGVKTVEYRPPSRSSENCPKLAERIRLRRMDYEFGDNSAPLGADISGLGVSSTSVAEHLVQELRDDSRIHEKMHGLDNPAKIKEFEIELDKLRSQAGHLRSQMEVLDLSLGESRTNSERLATLGAQYEANVSALQLALRYSDYILEATEAVHELSRTVRQVWDVKHGTDYPNSTTLKKRGGSSNPCSEALNEARMGRKQALISVRRLIGDFEAFGGNATSPSFDSNGHFGCDNANCSMSPCGGENCCTPSEPSREEAHLRHWIDLLKADLEAIRHSITPVGPTSDFGSPPPRAPSSSSGLGSSLESQRLDLENAVLMQELSSLKEERADLKAQLYLSEREKSNLNLALKGKAVELAAYKIQVKHLNEEIDRTKADQSRVGSHSDDTVSLASSVSSVADPMTFIHSRMLEMVNAVETLSQNADLRQQQATEFISDLKRANGALVDAFERSKRKQQGRIKKMERQLRNSEETYENEIDRLKRYAETLEKRLSASRNRPGRTETQI